MKKFTRGLLITAGILLVAGIGFSVTGAVLGGSLEEAVMDNAAWTSVAKSFGNIHIFGWDFGNDFEWDDDDEDISEQTAYSAEGDRHIYEAAPTKRLDVKLKYASLTFEKYDGEQLRVEVNHDPDAYIRVGEFGDRLKIVGTKKKKNQTVTIYYPEKTDFEELRLEMGAGSIEMKGDITADTLRLEVGAGEFSNQGSITVNDCRLELGAGEINMKGLTVKELKGECGAGSMELALMGKQTDYNYSLGMGIGEILLGNDSYAGLGKEKRIENAGAYRSVDLECGVGEITVKFQ